MHRCGRSCGERNKTVVDVVPVPSYPPCGVSDCGCFTWNAADALYRACTRQYAGALRSATCALLASIPSKVERSGYSVRCGRCPVSRLPSCEPVVRALWPKLAALHLSSAAVRVPRVFHVERPMGHPCSVGVVGGLACGRSVVQSWTGVPGRVPACALHDGQTSLASPIWWWLIVHADRWAAGPGFPASEAGTASHARGWRRSGTSLPRLSHVARPCRPFHTWLVPAARFT